MEDLIEKFWAGKASVEERKALLNKLSEQEEAWQRQLKEMFESDLAAGHSQISDERLNGILSQLHFDINQKENGISSTVKIFSMRVFARWAAAAVLLMGIGLGIFQWLNSRSVYPTENHQVSVQPHTTRIFALQKVKQMLLPDSSELTIYPGGSVTYDASFNHTNRNIRLERGVALFHVAKNPKKPFTVFAGTTSTTALGTRFKVDAQNNESITVSLYEGKVVVRSVKPEIQMQDIYLAPGQQITFNDQQRKARLESVLPAEMTAENPIVSNTYGLLDFNKTPLPIVFDHISAFYHLKINYNKAILKGLTFTGRFTPKDRPDMALSIVCKLNNLSYRRIKDIIIISKK